MPPVAGPPVASAVPPVAGPPVAGRGRPRARRPRSRLRPDPVSSGTLSAPSTQRSSRTVPRVEALPDHPTRQLDGPSVAVRSVVESISTPGNEGSPQRVAATNVYVLTDAGWRMAMHHASPPEVLDAPPEDDEDDEPHTLH